jgi:predicted phosphoribosyltransferase
MSFKDRSDAGRKLAARLAKYKDERPVILALPRGGAPVAAEVAAALGAPLDLVLVRKIGAPAQPELAMGAVVDGDAPIIVRNEDIIRLAGVDEPEFEAVCASERTEIERRRQRYFGQRARIDVAGRPVIVIDDGVATGATARAALKAIRARHPRKLVLALPVAATEALAALRDEHEKFGAIGYFYDDFRQTTDQDVIDILARFPPQADRN